MLKPFQLDMYSTSYSPGSQASTPLFTRPHIYVCYVVNYHHDVGNAENVFQLRTPVFISETQAYEDEIRTGLWEAGEFVEVRN